MRGGRLESEGGPASIGIGNSRRAAESAGNWMSMACQNRQDGNTGVVRWLSSAKGLAAPPGGRRRAAPQALRRPGGDKVAKRIGDCRGMGTEVPPPNINASK
jgi:DNA polymerase III alpha subunit